jgi:plastocyanin
MPRTPARGRRRPATRHALDGRGARRSHWSVHRLRRVRSIVPVVAVVLTVAALAAGCSAGGGSAPVPSFAGASVTIQARNIAFDPDIVTLPAGQPLRLVLDNQDAGIGHNLHVFQGSTDIAQSPTVIGPGTTTVELGTLAPGRYQFQCTIHPSMIGTVIVEAGGVAGPSSSDGVAPTDAPPSEAPSSGAPSGS